MLSGKALVAAVASALGCAAMAPAIAATDAPTINEIRAHPFESKTGRMSSDLLAGPRTGLWNSYTGPQASSATLFVVAVQGRPGGAYTGQRDALPRYRLRLVVTEGPRQRRLLDSQQVLPILGDDGKAFIPFLVTPGGCEAVHISATLIGPKNQASAPKSATLAMACGE